MIGYVYSKVLIRDEKMLIFNFGGSCQYYKIRFLLFFLLRNI